MYMSVNIPPPEFNFPSLQYNPEFWLASSSETLTQSIANTLYLRKTTTDSASALETFNGGILTASLDSTVTTLDIFNAVTGRLGIAVNNTGAANPINIGQTSSSVHCSDVDLQGTTIHGVVHATSNLSICDGQTSGVLNLGTNTARTADIHIGDGVGSTAIVKIGNSTSAVNVGSLKVQGASLNGATVSSSPLNIGDSQISGILHIGDNAARTAAFFLGAGTGGITLGTPLLPVYTSFSNTGQIGYQVAMTPSVFTAAVPVSPTMGNVATYLTVNQVPVGLWLFEMTCTLSVISLDTILSFSTTSATHDVTRAASFSPSSVATTYYARLTTIMSFGSATNFYLVGSANVAQTIAGLTVSRTRIA